MYIVVEHEISNPKAFWDIVKSATLPTHLKLHQTLPNGEGTKAVCVWEATGVDEVKVFLEGALGNFSRNTYFAVEEKNAIGLPTAVMAGVTM